MMVLQTRFVLFTCLFQSPAIEASKSELCYFSVVGRGDIYIYFFLSAAGVGDLWLALAVLLVAVPAAVMPLCQLSRHTRQASGPAHVSPKGAYLHRPYKVVSRLQQRD